MAEGTCWPTTDYLFELGVKELTARLGRDDFYFINLNELLLYPFVIEMPVSNERENIVICSNNLIPLANYLYNNHSCISAVFQSNISIECIARELKVFNPCKRRLSAYSSQPVLSKNEFKILQLMANGMDVKTIALEKGLKVSTVYTYRKRLYDKLNFCRAGQPSFKKTQFKC